MVKSKNGGMEVCTCEAEFPIWEHELLFVSGVTRGHSGASCEEHYTAELITLEMQNADIIWGRKFSTASLKFCLC